MKCKNVFYLLVWAGLAFATLQAQAEAAVTLGTAQNFAVLAGSAVTNTGSTTIYGNVGVSPQSAVTGFPPGIVTGGTIHANDAVAIQAQSDLTTAYNALAAMPPTANLTGTNLGGLTLGAGVYHFDSAAQLTGTLTLDAQNNANAEFIFQIGSTLITASGSSVNLINGADPCNVYWQVGSSATLGTATQFAGNILALTSITLNTGAIIGTGRALARNGAVTMDTNAISIAKCLLPPNATPDTTPPTVTVVILPGPPKQVQITAQDTGSGILSIIVNTSTNATTTVPPFTPGTTSTVIVTSTKINDAKISVVKITVTDVQGNVTIFDPVMATITREKGPPVPVQVSRIVYAEHYVRITNGNPGLTGLEIDVNGRKFPVKALKNNEVRTVNVVAAMRTGNKNVITLTAVGSAPQGQKIQSADVLIWDGR